MAPASETGGLLSVVPPGPNINWDLFHVPAADFDGRLGRAQLTGTVRRSDFALLARHQRNVVVFPNDGENLVSLDALVDFQAHKKGETLARVFENHAGDLF